MLSDRQVRIFWQVLIVLATVAVLAVCTMNARANLEAAGISLSFGFLESRAGFDISDSLIPLSSDSSYSRVLLAGVLNTLVLSLSCITGATIIGLLIGVLRTSGHYLGVQFARLYIELNRNLPKLLILLALLLAVINTLPPVRQSLSTLDLVFISNRAVYFPMLEHSSGATLLAAMALILPLVLLALSSIAARVQDRTGKRYAVFWPVILVFTLVAAAAGVSGLVDFPVSQPVLTGFDYVDGGRISIQFLVLTAALSIYHGGQVAEIVRGAIEAVPEGQFDAGRAAGFSFLQMTRLIVLPQAFRVAVPPMGNQYLNITKNTSIALAVGYSDLVSVVTTSINQTFRPIELMSLSMLIYLSICLVVSAAVNFFNARVTRRDI